MSILCNNIAILKGRAYSDEAFLMFWTAGIVDGTAVVASENLGQLGSMSQHQGRSLLCSLLESKPSSDERSGGCFAICRGPCEAVTSACIQPFEARCTVSMHIMSHTSAPLEFGEPASEFEHA